MRHILGSTPPDLHSAPRSNGRAPRDWSSPDATARARARVILPVGVPAAGALSRGLGNAMLSGPWEPAAMLESAGPVLGSRRRWLRVLIRDVLARYPRPPADRPRELAAFVGGHPSFRHVIRGARQSGDVRARRIPPAVVRMADRRPWPVPVIDHLGDLAQWLAIDQERLDWLADVKGLQRRAAPGPLHHYRYRWVVARSGRARLLEAPKPWLRTVQRTVLDELLAYIPVHPGAHGFVPGRSAITGARPHVGAPLIISLDLEAFFASLTAGRVYGVFRAAGYAQPVAHVLTGLCTTRTPVAALREMPRGTDPSAAFRQRKMLAAGHLPQGAPTSPALANLCVMRLDRRLAGLAAACGAAYTRYADDLVFSGPKTLHSDRVIAAVARITTEEGLRLQPAKTRVRRSHQRQEVTGIVVNAGTNPGRREYDELKALLHNASRFGPVSQNRGGVPDFRAHLLGRIAWVEQLNPARAQRLRATFDTITW